MFKKKEKIKYYREREIKKKGNYDGRTWRWRFGWPLREEKDAIPSMDDKDPSPFEKQLIKDAEADLEILMQMWEEEDQNLYTKCQRAWERCKNARNRYDSAKEKKEKEVGEYEGEDKGALKEYIGIEKTFDNYPKPHLTSVVGLLLIGIITVAEGFFNLLVFNIFGQSRLETLLMAIGIVVAIPVCGFFVGSKLKLKAKNKTDVFMMIIASFIVIVGLAIIALLREVFLEAMQVKETIGIKMGSSTMGLSFFIINVLLFIAILVIEYERSHEDPDEYNKLKESLKNAKTKLEKEKGEAIEAIKEFEDAQKEVEESRKELRAAITSRILKFDQFKAKATEKRDRWISLIHLYRDANMAARKKGESQPKIFMSKFDENTISIPSKLQNLGWEQGEKEKYLKLLEKGESSLLEENKE